MLQQLYPCFRHWSEAGTIWIYSDTHFNDPDVRNKANRPDDEWHVARINSFVGRKDTLIILGDVGDLEYAARLRGNKVLVCGNHDAGGTTYTDVFREVYPGPLFISEKILLSHERIDLPFAFNIHGHDHVKQDTDPLHTNVCADVTGFTPLHFQKFLKSGAMARVPSIHRMTIDGAVRRKAQRGRKG